MLPSASSAARRGTKMGQLGPAENDAVQADERRGEAGRAHADRRRGPVDAGWQHGRRNGRRRRLRAAGAHSCMMRRTDCGLPRRERRRGVSAL